MVNLKNVFKKKDFSDAERLINLPTSEFTITDIQLAKGYLVAYKNEKEDLIEYLEQKIDDIKCVYCYKENDFKESGKFQIYQDILERVKSGKYE